MNKSKLAFKGFLTFFTTLMFCSAVQAAVSRTFVSGTGSDANACTRTAPCRTFQKAHDTVGAGGQVIALDSAGYGGLTITKSVTITGEGVEANAGVDAGDAIAIATAGINVVLRSISIEGFGSGINGINVTAGMTLSVQNCVINGFSGGGASNGIRFVPGSGTARLFISGCKVRNSSGNAIYIDGDSAILVASIGSTRLEKNGNGLVISTAKVTIRDSVTSGNTGEGMDAVGTGAELSVETCESSNNGADGIEAFLGIVRVSNSVISNNTGFGFLNSSGTFESLGNNTVRGNNGGGPQTSGTITPITGI